MELYNQSPKCGLQQNKAINYNLRFNLDVFMFRNFGLCNSITAKVLNNFFFSADHPVSREISYNKTYWSDSFDFWIILKLVVIDLVFKHAGARVAFMTLALLVLVCSIQKEACEIQKVVTLVLIPECLFQ